MNRDEFDRMRSMLGQHNGIHDWIMPGVLLLIGLPLVLGALWSAGGEFLFRATAMHVQGTVIERTGDVPALVVEYKEDNGTPHRLETFGSDNYQDIEVGQKVPVYVSRAHPENARLGYFTEGYMLPLILGIFGSFFAIPGALFARSQLRPLLIARNLETKGQRIQADVIDIEPALTMAGMRSRMQSGGSMSCTIQRDGSGWKMTINGQVRDPFDPSANLDWGIQYRVVAQWRDQKTGKTHQSTSEPVDVVPAPVMMFRNVTVLVDPDNPKNCRVELGTPMPQSMA